MLSKYHKLNIFEDLESEVENSNCGIYKITNLKNNKGYIGQSSDIKKRWRNHKFELKNNIHNNPYLQNAFNKYGEEAFEFRIIEKTSKENLDEAEEYWIDYFDSTNPEKGYNLKYGGNSSKVRADIQEQINLARELDRVEAHYFKMRHINNNGGFTKLYELAKENKTQKQAALDLKVPQSYIKEYLNEQGISTWHELVKQARGFKDDYTIIDEKGGVLFIIDELVNGKSIKEICENLNIKRKFFNDYLNYKGINPQKLNNQISKWTVELGLKNFGGVTYIKKNLKLGLTLDEISEECKISKSILSKYLKKNSSS